MNRVRIREKYGIVGFPDGAYVLQYYNPKYQMWRDLYINPDRNIMQYYIPFAYNTAVNETAFQNKMLEIERRIRLEFIDKNKNELIDMVMGK